MIEPGSEDGRLDELRLRWRQDPSSRVFVQLADEYRRRGRLGEAVEVLEEGLRGQPTYITAQAALGRCRLELGDAQGAVSLLEAVVAEDTTHMLANKLLVEAYLRLGRWDEARQRLELYDLLNDSDPEIPELRERVEAGKAATPSTPGEAPATAASSEPAAAADNGGGEPFGTLVDDEIRRRYLEGLGGEGIFPWLVEAEAPIAEVGEEPEPAAADAYVELEAAPEPASEPELSSEPAPAEPAAEAPAEAAPVDADEAQPEEATDEPTATVTLGNLYLKQGHPEEAARIFQRVLGRDPGNAAAREALARLEPPAAERAPERAAPTAAELAASLLAGAPSQGVTARKVTMLNRYLDRIRRPHVS